MLGKVRQFEMSELTDQGSEIKRGKVDYMTSYSRLFLSYFRAQETESEGKEELVRLVVGEPDVRLVLQL